MNLLELEQEKKQGRLQIEWVALELLVLSAVAVPVLVPLYLSGKNRIVNGTWLQETSALAVGISKAEHVATSLGSRMALAEQRLNEVHGVTIVAATHDPLVMGYARRQVRLRDGEIIEDSARQAA